MPQAKLLIADDETPVRTALSAALDEFGYEVRGAENGFAALAEIRREIPDLIIADLHMPHMSGFELLSVVRRRFPSIGAIAMSGSYSSDGVPPGVAAEAFYEKGTHPGLLFRIVKAMTQAERRPAREGPNPLAPIWIPRNGHDPAGQAFVMITCTECLRTFSQVLGEGAGTIRDASCVYCSSPIQYAIVQQEHAGCRWIFIASWARARPLRWACRTSLSKTTSEARRRRCMAFGAMGVTKNPWGSVAPNPENHRPEVRRSVLEP